MTDFTIEQTVARIAAQIFASYGVDFATARRAGGWSNATWIAGGLALRIATHKGSENIRRETRLSVLLPAEVGYPISVETGVTDSYEWNLSKEIPGICLEDIWSSLNWDDRVTALRGLWAKAQAVHRVVDLSAAHLARQSAWYNDNDPAAAEAAITRAADSGYLSIQGAAVLNEGLARFWSARERAEYVLAHGDLTIGNALWHAGKLVSLLDFEFALMAPIEIDLNVLLKPAFGVDSVPQNPSEADQIGWQRLCQTAIEIAQPVLARPGGWNCLFGYAILLDLFRFELFLAHPENEGEMAQWQPYRALRSLADGQGGYLAALKNLTPVASFRNE